MARNRGPLKNDSSLLFVGFQEEMKSDKRSRVIRNANHMKKLKNSEYDLQSSLCNLEDPDKMKLNLKDLHKMQEV